MVELVIAVSIFTGSIVVMGNILSLQLTLAIKNEDRIQAVFLAEEVFEALRFLRTEDWTNIDGLANSVSYVLNESAGSWSITTSGSGQPLPGYYRVFHLGAVNRDANDDITASGGTLDTDIRSVTATVSWYTSQGTSTYSVYGYVTNLFK